MIIKLTSNQHALSQTARPAVKIPLRACKLFQLRAVFFFVRQQASNHIQQRERSAYLMYTRPLPIFWRGPPQHIDQFGPPQRVGLQRGLEIRPGIASRLRPAARNRG